MAQKSFFIRSFIGLVPGSILLFLFYLWSAQMHYSMLVPGSSLTLPVAIRYGELHWHGPDLLTLILVGFLSSSIACLVFYVLLPRFKKSSLWVGGSICFFGLTGIVLLGFFMPLFSLM